MTTKPKAKATTKGGGLSRPAALKPGHALESFDCGRDAINKWLQTRARRAAENDTARTYVVVRGTKRVVGYYALSVGAVEHRVAPGALRRNAPDPIPVIILARFGVDKKEQGQGLGKSLMADAMRRALNAARIVGARALIIHALDDEAAAYYRSLNFAELNDNEQTFFVTMKEVRDALA